MKEIKMKRGFVAMVDDEDYEHLNQWKWHVLITNKNIYARRDIRGEVGQTTKMHRLIMNAPKDKEVDHIDHNGLNKQKSNLRICTHAQNCMNVNPVGKSRYLGVCLTRNGNGNPIIRSTIRTGEKRITIGQFKTEIEAAKAYDKMAKKYHGDFANLNFK